MTPCVIRASPPQTRVRDTRTTTTTVATAHSGQPSRLWRRETRAPRPQSLRNRQADARSPLGGSTGGNRPPPRTRSRRPRPQPAGREWRPRRGRTSRRSGTRRGGCAPGSAPPRHPPCRGRVRRAACRPEPCPLLSARRTTLAASGAGSPPGRTVAREGLAGRRQISRRGPMSSAAMYFLDGADGTAVKPPYRATL